MPRAKSSPKRILQARVQTHYIQRLRSAYPGLTDSEILRKAVKALVDLIDETDIRAQIEAHRNNIAYLEEYRERLARYGAAASDEVVARLEARRTMIQTSLSAPSKEQNKRWLTAQGIPEAEWERCLAYLEV